MYISTVFKFALVASAVIPTVLGAPVPKESSTTSSLERRPESHLENYEPHDGHLAEYTPPHVRPGSLATRGYVNIYARDPVDKKNIKVAEDVKKGLHGIDPAHHDAIIDYHKDMVKQHMESIPGAHSAVIHHSEHYGGSNPLEPLHVTAEYFDKGGNKIHSQYAINKANAGQKSEGLHHVYNNQLPNPVPQPQAWTEQLAKHKAEHDAKLPGLMQGKAKEKANNDKLKQAAADKVTKEQQANAARVQKQKDDAAKRGADRVKDKQKAADTAEEGPGDFF